MQKVSVWQDILLGGVAVIAVGFAGNLLTTRAATQVENKPQGMTIQQQDKIDEAAASTILGSFRTSVADFLWLKVDKYMHNGVELRGLTETEKRSEGSSDVHTSESDVQQGYKQHSDETTVIPSAQHDWRGRLGDIEREVQPYADMSHHSHRDPKEALPLFRLMTRANPHFIPGYTYGAAMIARDKSKYDEALAFLKEGEANNPNSIEIKTEIGNFYVAKMREYALAEPYLIQALQIVANKDIKALSDDEKEAWEGAYRWLVLAYRYQGKREQAHAIARAGLRFFPDDAVCRKQLEIEKTGEWRKFISQ